MRRRPVIYALTLAHALAYLPGPARAGDWPFHHKPKPGEPVTLEQVAKEIDHVEDKVLDDGTVVVKHPDVYGQSRMTLYRKNFEQQLYGAIGKFNIVLAGRAFRSDQAALSSQTSLQASLSAKAGATGNGPGPKATSSPSPSNSTTIVNTPNATPGNAPAFPSLPFPGGLADNSIARSSNATNLANSSGMPFSLGFSDGTTPYGLGVEPTVYLDQLADFQRHLNQIRRVNMGDDIADSAGYGLYLIRMPVSIQPGECTNKGHGAVLTATVYHDFPTDFLYTTFRNLAINDLVDQLTPLVYEMIRSRALDRLPSKFANHVEARKWYVDRVGELIQLDQSNSRRGRVTNYFDKYQMYSIFLDPITEENTPKLSSQGDEPSLFGSNTANFVNSLTPRLTSLYQPITRVNDRSYPIPGTEMDNVFIEQNLVMLALHARDAMQSQTPRADEVRGFLRREIESTYDVISQIYGEADPGAASRVARLEDLVATIAGHVRQREYQALFNDCRDVAKTLPGMMRYVPGDDPESRGKEDRHTSLTNAMAILAYAIGVEMGLLDDQLRLDMKRVLGKDGVDCSDIDALHFYPRHPSPEAEARFQEYIKTRWPMIAFSIEPDLSEQNIAEASSVRRDLQLALAFAFSTGQIGFNQLVQYQRRLEYDTETIALNQTVSSFIHDNDTFGFRFRPRFQTPPPERSNFQALTNQLLKGGPGRNYQLNNSKLEPGQRELAAIIIMPSFLQTIKMDVTGNWFPLVDPDQMKTPTPRMIAQGRKVVELRESLAGIHDHKHYRPGDINRLTTRVKQIEQMLPMQTHEIRVPYENTLGGFQLFQQGTSALVPQLDAFEGSDGISDQGTDLLLYGKHFSVQETYVVIGGKYLNAPSLDVAQAANAAQASLGNAKNALDSAAQPQQQSGQGAGKSGNTQGSAPGGTTPGKTPTDGATTPVGGATPPSNPTTPGTSQTPTNPASQGVQQAQQSLLNLQLSISAPPAGGGGGNPGGGSTATNALVDVVSREVLRVSIPAGVQPTVVLDADRQGTQTYVEVYVATPNGISNRLLIPYRPKGTAAPAAPTFEPGASAVNVAYTYTIRPIWDLNGEIQAPPPQGLKAFFKPGDASDKTLAIKVHGVAGVLPATMDVIFNVMPPNGVAAPAVFVTMPAALGQDGSYLVDISTLPDQLLGKPDFAKFFRGRNESPTVTATLSLKPMSAGFEAVPNAVSGTLTLNIKAGPAAAPKAVPPQPPAPGAQGANEGQLPDVIGPDEAALAPTRPRQAPPRPGAAVPAGQVMPDQAAPATGKPAAPKTPGGAGGNGSASARPQASARPRPVAPATPRAGAGRDEALARSSYRPSARGRAADPVDLPPLPTSRPNAATGRSSATKPGVMAGAADRKSARPGTPARGATASKSDAPDGREPARRLRWPWPSQ